MASIDEQEQGWNADRRFGLLAGASVLGAVIASSCCIVPLVLVTLGISGAWIGNPPRRWKPGPSRSTT